ncbi:hypothetical protein Sjap_010434 [Stephania japonica]|uniref:Uncharacterized protein n=1 Tax=Stephania japonica TaxID=461633 RepID=A0AAP0JBL7_9MAGN
MSTVVVEDPDVPNKGSQHCCRNERSERGCGNAPRKTNKSIVKTSFTRKVKKPNGVKPGKVVPDGAVSFSPPVTPKRCDWITPHSGNRSDRQVPASVFMTYIQFLSYPFCRNRSGSCFLPRRGVGSTSS